LLAHHSFGAEYDADKPVTLTGIVTRNIDEAIGSTDHVPFDEVGMPGFNGNSKPK